MLLPNVTIARTHSERRHQQKRQEQCALHGFVHDEQAAGDVEDPAEQAQDEASPLLYHEGMASPSALR